ncbi:hypothetical protein TSIB_1713 [Thermococcus sibiricus MM 739]|uniref:Uncharacterized protein n=1 Tax=Thermococcus sibiricus (strain DSM 12597 / MM 739) TaxID=604354 RepID=C6A569_THESM|nr:hypothetical protein TSIB_1713 [Thermococcus sibiricus MM 739]
MFGIFKTAFTIGITKIILEWDFYGTYSLQNGKIGMKNL